MDHRISWAASKGRRTMSVTVDEGDVVRMLTAAGIPAETRAKLTTQEAHVLLKTEAEIYILEDRAAHDEEIAAQDAGKAAQGLRKVQQQTLKAIRTRLGIAEPAEPEAPAEPAK